MSAMNDDNLCQRPRDGGKSYSGRHPTSVFAPTIHLARPLQTCWHIHHPSPTRQGFFELPTKYLRDTILFDNRPHNASSRWNDANRTTLRVSGEPGQVAP